MAAARRLFFFCRRPADYYLLSKKEPITANLCFADYRLCVCASGSLITVIFNLWTLIRFSCLHFGQYKGKFLSTVSSRIFNLDAMVEMIKVRLFFWFILILLKLHKPHNGVFKYRNVYLVINVFLITCFKN